MTHISVAEIMSGIDTFFSLDGSSSGHFQSFLVQPLISIAGIKPSGEKNIVLIYPYCQVFSETQEIQMDDLGYKKFLATGINKNITQTSYPAGLRWYHIITL